jgi:hypothetical protein
MANSSIDTKNVAAPKPADALPGKKPFNRDWLCVGLFLLVTTFTFSSFIFSGNMLVSSDQLASVGVRQFLDNSLSQHGQLPHWDATRLSGMPTVDAKFGDVLYPVTAFVRPFTPAYRVFGITMVLHVFLAGVFFYFMMRRSFGTVRLVAFASALFYMLSPQFVSHVYPGHDGKMFVIAWLPFIIWRLRSVLAVPTLRNAALMAVGIAMMMLTGHVQMTYFVCLGIFLYWVTDLVKAIAGKEEKGRIAGKTVFFWVAVFAGLGISFVQLYPSYMYVREAFSVRGVDRGFEFAASWAMGWPEFFSLWVHQFGNSLEYYWGQNFFKLNTEYAGAMPLLLTFLAIASKPKSLWRLFWAGIAVLAVFYSLGASTPFFTLVYHTIPGVRRFRAPSMMMFWFTFATALMSAFFLKDLLAKRFEVYGEQRKKWKTRLMAALGGVTLLAILFSVESFVTSFAASMMGDGKAAQVFNVNFGKNFVPNLWLWWFFAAVSLGMLLAVVNGKLKPAVLVCALIVMGTIDMARVNGQFIAVESPWKYFHRSDPTLTRLRGEMDKAPFRVFSLPRTFTTQNQEGFYGLEGVGGFHDNELNCYRAFRGDQGDRHYLEDITQVTAAGMSLSMAKIMGRTPFLDLANVNYILMGSGTGIESIRNPTALGRLSYAADFVVMDEASVIGALRFGEYDYKTTVALLEEPKLPFERRKKQPYSAASGVDEPPERLADEDEGAVADAYKPAAVMVDHPSAALKVEWKRYSPNRRVAAVTMPADGFLRISEVHYPGWKISVDGTPVKYYRSDMAWMAVPLKAGSYEVVMMPKSLYLGGATVVTVISAIMTALVLIFAFIRGRKRVVGQA